MKILLVVATPNDVEVPTGNIQNLYPTEKCRETIYTIAGPEFGLKKGSHNDCQNGTLQSQEQWCGIQVKVGRCTQ